MRAISVKPVYACGFSWSRSGRPRKPVSDSPPLLTFRHRFDDDQFGASLVALVKLSVNRAGISFGIVRNDRDPAKFSAQRNKRVRHDVSFLQRERFPRKNSRIETMNRLCRFISLSSTSMWRGNPKGDFFCNTRQKVLLIRPRCHNQFRFRRIMSRQQSGAAQLPNNANASFKSRRRQ